MNPSEPLEVHGYLNNCMVIGMGKGSYMISNDPVTPALFHLVQLDVGKLAIVPTLDDYLLIPRNALTKCPCCQQILNPDELVSA